LIENIGLEIRKATISMRDSGLEARIPNSRKLYEQAQTAWSEDQTDADVERHYRAACLVHGAMLVARGRWSEAIQVYSVKGFARGGEGAVTPLPPTLCNQSTQFAAMMALGESISRVRSNRDYADEAATEAVRWFVMLNDPRLSPWHGAALLVMAHESQKQGHDVRGLAAYARTLLDPYEQPELCVLAEHYAGMRDGYVKTSRFRKRPATFQAVECLYLFNVPHR